MAIESFSTEQKCNKGAQHPTGGQVSESPWLRDTGQRLSCTQTSSLFSTTRLLAYSDLKFVMEGCEDPFQHPMIPDFCSFIKINGTCDAVVNILPSPCFIFFTVVADPY